MKRAISFLSYFCAIFREVITFMRIEREKAMKRVFIHAFMAGNLGDDLMVRILCSRYPKVHFFVFADASYHTRYRDLKNLTVFAPEDRKTRVLNQAVRRLAGREDGARKFLMKTSHAAVHIGGSVFVQHLDDWSGFYAMDEQLVRLSRTLFVVGANFGPYTDPGYREQYRQLFEGYRDICFRDSCSKKEFSQADNIRWAPDVVFQYKEIPKVSAERQVLFSVIDLTERGGKYPVSQYREVYEKFMKDLAVVFLRQGYRVKFISFCRMQKDEEAARRIQKEIRKEVPFDTELICYDQNLEECMQAFAASEMIVGTRFHSIILGMCMEKKVLPVIYDYKTRNMLNDLFPYSGLEFGELEHLSAAQAAEQLKASEPYRAEQAVREAQEQFAALDRFLLS